MAFTGKSLKKEKPHFRRCGLTGLEIDGVALGVNSTGDEAKRIMYILLYPNAQICEVPLKDTYTGSDYEATSHIRFLTDDLPVITEATATKGPIAMLKLKYAKVMAAIASAIK